MGGSFQCQVHFVSILLLYGIKWSNEGTAVYHVRIYCTKLLLSVTYIFVEFLVSPGDGEELVYSPVEVNATIHCSVNNTMLAWEVDGLNFDNEFKRNELHSRGIFKNEPILSSNGVTASNLTVFGDIDMNSNTRVCCESLVRGRKSIRQNCTTLIIYGMRHYYGNK